MLAALEESRLCWALAGLDSPFFKGEREKLVSNLQFCIVFFMLFHTGFFSMLSSSRDIGQNCGT